MRAVQNDLIETVTRPKRILIIAGPNGAGKTTYANAYLVKGGYRHFVNADLIAKGLSPFDPDSAAIQAGLTNFHQIYRDLVDDWALIDNSGDEHVIIDWKLRHETEN